MPNPTKPKFNELIKPNNMAWDVFMVFVYSGLIFLMTFLFSVALGVAVSSIAVGFISTLFFSFITLIVFLVGIHDIYSKTGQSSRLNGIPNLESHWENARFLYKVDELIG